MKLIGNLKKKVENAETKEEAKEAIKKAGMLLTDGELDMVSGGGFEGLEGCGIWGCQRDCSQCPRNVAHRKLEGQCG